MSRSKEVNGESMLECGCPAVYPDWDGKDVDLGGWLVHEQKAPMFLHMPIGYESWLMRQYNDIQRLQLHERWPGFRLTQSAMFRGRILCPLKEEHSPARNTYRLPNPFYLRARIVHGDIGGIRETVRAMQSELLDEGKMPKELYLSYLTCPLCQEKRGGMRIMVLRHWVHSKKLQKRIEQNQRSS